MLAKDNKKFEKRKGRCDHCGKQNVTNIYIEGDELYPSMWLCWKCAEKECGIKPPQEKGLTQSLGDIMREKGIKL